MTHILQSWKSSENSHVSLDAAGLVALADLSTVARRTALTGTSAIADALILCPGLHTQQRAPELNGGEYAACAAMTTGYVFRIENQAMMVFLQKISRTGELTCLKVSNDAAAQFLWTKTLCKIYDFHGTSFVATLAYFTALALTLTDLILLVLLQDWWGLAVILGLILARVINLVIICRRAQMGWKGEPEPGEKSDLIILLSQDKWVRLRGDTDDVKAITSGEWLREPTFVESSLVAFATLIVYLDAALAGSGSREGKLLLLLLLFCSVGLLGLANEYTEVLKIYGRTVEIDGKRQPYARRLLLAKKLIKETGRSDWAIRLGMLQAKDVEPSEDKIEGPNSSLKADTHAAAADEQVIL